MRKSWIAIVAVALVAAAGGLVAGRALAEDDPMAGGGMPPMEACVDGNALVKALTANKWTHQASMGELKSEGTVSFRLGVGNTVLLEEYEAKGDMGTFSGLAVFKWSADAKTATVWWFDSMSPKPTVFTGPVTDTGYELSGEMHDMEGKPTTGVIKLVTKGEGFEFTMTSGGKVLMTDVFTKAK